MVSINESFIYEPQFLYSISGNFYVNSNFHINFQHNSLLEISSYKTVNILRYWEAECGCSLRNQH
jgi:hypothetical protein